jgi:hypothetical protein
VCALDLQNGFERNKLVTLSAVRREVYHFLSAEAVVNRSTRTAPTDSKVGNTVERLGAQSWCFRFPLGIIRELNRTCHRVYAPTRTGRILAENRASDGVQCQNSAQGGAKGRKRIILDRVAS